MRATLTTTILAACLLPLIASAQSIEYRMPTPAPLKVTEAAPPVVVPPSVAPTWAPNTNLGIVADFAAVDIVLPPATDNNELSLTYSIVGGLPTGWTFNPSTLTFSGGPSVNGEWNITVRAADILSATDVTFAVEIVS